MKAISLWPPYGSLIVAGVKRIETRSRPWKYRGRIAIYQTLTVPKSVAASRNYRDVLLLAIGHLGVSVPSGKVVGTVEIEDCREVDRVWGILSDTEDRLGDYTYGRFAWMLINPVKFNQPIPCKGKQGIWIWNESEYNDQVRTAGFGP